MYQLEKDLIDELNDNKKEILENENLLHEYVDSHIPVYNFDRLQLACDDLYLGYPSESGILRVAIMLMILLLIMFMKS